MAPIDITDNLGGFPCYANNATAKWLNKLRSGAILADKYELHIEKALTQIIRTLNRREIAEFDWCTVSQISILLVPISDAERLRKEFNRLHAAGLDVIIGPSDPWSSILLETLCAERKMLYIRRAPHCEFAMQTSNTTLPLTDSFTKNLVTSLLNEWKWNQFTIVYSKDTRKLLAESFLLNFDFSSPCQIHEIITDRPNVFPDFLEVEEISQEGFMIAATKLRDTCDRKACWSQVNRVLLLMNAQDSLDFLDMSLKLGLINSINWFLLFNLDSLYEHMEPYSHNKMRISLVVPRNVLSSGTKSGLSKNSQRVLQEIYADWRKNYPLYLKSPQRDFSQLFESVIFAYEAAEKKTSTTKAMIPPNLPVNSSLIDVWELGINGQPIHTGIWNSSGHGKLLMQAKNIPYTHEHAIQQLKSMRILKVTSIAEKPYVMKKVLPSGQIVYEGFCVDLLNRMAKNLNFEYELNIVADGKYGEPKKNSSDWDGMIGEILRGEADMAVAPITVTALRLEVVDFTDPFLQLGISMLMRKPDQKSRVSITSFLLPLTSRVWSITLVAILLTTVILTFVSYITATDTKKSFPILNSIWFLACILLRASSGYGCPTFASRVVSTAWWAFTLVLIAQYTANFAAVLTVAGRSMPFNSFEELGNQTEYTFGSIFGGSTAQFFKYSRIETFEKIWQRMSAMGNESFVYKNDQGVNRSLETKYVFLMESASLEYRVAQNCNLTKVGNVVLGSNGYSIALPKGSRWREKLTRQILDFNEKGIIMMLKKKWWTSAQDSKCVEENQVVGQPLGMDRMAGLFILLFGGLIFSFIVGLLEKFLHRIPANIAGFHPILIAKTMSTTMKVMLCDLMRRQRGLPEHKIITGKQSNICYDNNWYRNTRSSRLLWRTSGNPSLIVVRDPIERFISIYGYICKKKKKSFCPPSMNIHKFARFVYRKLLTRATGGRIGTDKIIGHSQPSFWFAYERGRSLPRNIDVLYQSSNPQANAARLFKILVKRKVPRGIAKKVTSWVSDSRINSRRKPSDRMLSRTWENEIYSNKETLLTVLRTYYNDYRLLKIELPLKLQRAIKRYRIQLPHKLKRISGNRFILQDNCYTTHIKTRDERLLPKKIC
ncbi:unnamed protein product, partial [Mesorhabditis belari]|uniref:Uncharacterized protein n=1 Tax=Mesorhabditis belari TaxID=2138241 RepID=A0AAF3EGM8_9BILA